MQTAIDINGLARLHFPSRFGDGLAIDMQVESNTSIVFLYTR